MSTVAEVRWACAGDMPQLASMGYRFFEEGDLPGEFSPTAFLNFWRDAVAGDVGIVLVLEVNRKVVGTIGGLLFPCPLTGDRCAQELFWWVEAEHRGEVSSLLIEGFEQIASQKGAQRVLMSAVAGLRDRSLARWYGGRGYRPMEHSFVKDL